MIVLHFLVMINQSTFPNFSSFWVSGIMLGSLILLKFSFIQGDCYITNYILSP